MFSKTCIIIFEKSAIYKQTRKFYRTLTFKCGFSRTPLRENFVERKNKAFFLVREFVTPF
jgi:hypothetical protein